MSSETKVTKKEIHTPGPWFVSTPQVPSMQLLQTPLTYLKVVSKTSLIANFGTSSMDDYEEQLANARLIAAAPELLEALKMYVDSMLTKDYQEKWYQQYKDDKKANRELVAAIEAIIKAGGQP